MLSTFSSGGARVATPPPPSEMVFKLGLAWFGAVIGFDLTRASVEIHLRFIPSWLRADGIDHRRLNQRFKTVSITPLFIFINTWTY